MSETENKPKYKKYYIKLYIGNSGSIYDLQRDMYFTDEELIGISRALTHSYEILGKNGFLTLKLIYALDETGQMEQAVFTNVIGFYTNIPEFVEQKDADK